MTPAGPIRGPFPPIHEPVHGPDRDAVLYPRKRRHLFPLSIGSFCVSERRAVCHYSEEIVPHEEPQPRRSPRAHGAAASRDRGRERDAAAETSDFRRRRQRGGSAADGGSAAGEVASSQIALKR